MALCRIKNPEQLKQCKPGELGRIIGLDRVPEARNLRFKIQQIVEQQKAEQWNQHLLEQWLDSEACIYFYVDGHVRIYYGHQAQLTNKYVSRQKLCLSATTEYWVNNSTGLPYLVVTGELNEKLQEVIDKQIIPKLLQTEFVKQRQSQNHPVLFTLVFDREAYHPAFFNRLWNEHKIAIITYRKNVKDNYPIDYFKSYKVQVIENYVDMLLYEQNIVLDNILFREVRCLTQSGHQTAIITTHPTIPIEQIAGQMFSRWSQENFFRYLILDYDFDKMIEFGVDTIDENKEVVNPLYRQLTQRIKKINEKIVRLEAKFYYLIETVVDSTIDEIPSLSTKQAQYKLQIEQFKKEIEDLKIQRHTTKARIPLKEMPLNRRFNKLKSESKLLLNIIKMISYRAETALSEQLSAFFYKAKNEKRMIIKQIFDTPADLIPDYTCKTLTIRLYSLSTPRYNSAALHLCKLLTDTQSIFPGTDLTMIFKTTAN